MDNIPMIAQDLKNKINDFLVTECVGDDVSESEEEMYSALEYAAECIEEFLSTQQMTNRKFEIGKRYYDNNYNLHKVIKITPKGLWFHDAYGASRVQTSSDGNQFIRGFIDVKA